MSSDPASLVDGKETTGSVPGDLSVAKATRKSQTEAQAKEDNSKDTPPSSAIESSDQPSLFFSWNAKNPKIHNLKRALQEAAALNGLKYDESTWGHAGSPNIVAVILEKIRRASVFVADVTPVATLDNGEGVMNTNVAIEYGYACANMDNSRIILLKNHDSQQRFAFDIAAQRVSPVNSAASDIVGTLSGYVAASLSQSTSEVLRVVARVFARQQVVSPAEVRDAFQKIFSGQLSSFKVLSIPRRIYDELENKLENYRHMLTISHIDRRNSVDEPVVDLVVTKA